MTDKPTTDIGAAENLALASLILSIISLILIILVGFFATLVSSPGIICGHVAIKKYRSAGIQEGRGMAKAGIVVGWISLALSIVVSLVLLIWFQHVDQEMESMLDEIQNLR